jgi:two-component system, OmpR family, phosphate regulon sensor histidine kinase PhoR
MPLLKPHRKLILLFYILNVYIILQIVWWVYQIIDLAKKMDQSGGLAAAKTKMIIGEFAVFIVLLIAGIFYIRKVFLKEMALAENKKNFSLSITHELKTPITATKLMVETLQNRVLDKEKASAILEKINKEQDRLHELIEKILLASRIDTSAIQLEIMPIPAKKFIFEQLAKFPTTHTCQLDISEKAVIWVDAFLFASVIQNLHENALKYSPEGKTIIWELTTDKKQTILSVTDEGNGIAEEFHQTIFEPYFRIDNEETKSNKGTGLGLFLVKKIVQLHAGTISVKKGKSTGTRFEISLPIRA